MAPHSSTLAWKIPWMEEPGRLQSTGSLRVGHDWATSLSLFTFMHWRRQWQPTPVLLPGDSQGQGSLPIQVITEHWVMFPACYSSSHSYLLLLLLSRFSRVRLCATPQTAAHQAPPSLGFSRQEYWSGLPFPSPMHESEKWNLKSRGLCTYKTDPLGCTAETNTTL